MISHQGSYEGALEEDFERLGRRSVPLGMATGIMDPNWMIQFDDLLSSDVKGYEKYGEILGWQTTQGRMGTLGAAGSLQSEQTAYHSGIMVRMRVEKYFPTLQNKMNQGSNIKEVKLIQFANIEGVNQVVYEMSCKNCSIEKISQRGLDALIVIRPQTRKDTAYHYASDGKKKGQTCTDFNYRAGTAT